MGFTTKANLGFKMSQVVFSATTVALVAFVSWTEVVEARDRDSNLLDNEAWSLDSVRETLSQEPVVWIPDGGLKGFYMASVQGRKFAAFQAIPFAQPPVDQLRFQAPQKNVPWKGIRDAIVPSPTCIQADFFQLYKTVGQEDCLYLNVYTPKLPKRGESKLPVIVGIHYGGFFFGSANNLGPAYLLEEDVILVTMNYRLGAFGFLSTGDEVVPGNNGLKDQVLALKWVRENIRYFGGDPSRVTIMGESAGAGSVHYHMVSPLSKGLFHRGISQSGCAFCFWSVNEKGVELSHRLATLLNCPTSDSRSLVACLRNKNATDFTAVHPLLLNWATFPVALWAPVVEPDMPGAFLKELPEQTYRSGKVARIPWITGMNTDELAINVASIIGNPTFLSDFNSKWDDLVGPVMLELFNTTTNMTKTAEMVRDKYMSGKDLGFVTRQQAIQMFTDRYIVTCGVKAMRYHATLALSPVYSYQLNYRGKHSLVQLLGLDPKDWGVAHMDDQIYLVNNTVYYPELQTNEAAYNMSRIMISLWSNFAKDGVPYLPSKSGKPRYIWKPNTWASPELRFLSLNLNPEMIDNPYHDRLSFWENLKLHEGDYNSKPAIDIPWMSQKSSHMMTPMVKNDHSDHSTPAI